MKSFAAKIVLFWFALLALALFNAAVRELAYKPWLEPHIGTWAHQLSSLTGIALFFSAIYFFVKKSRSSYSPSQLWAMGLVWTALTIAFEVFMNMYVRHLSWQEVLETYYFWQGETWIFVLLAIAVSPAIAGRLTR